DMYGDGKTADHPKDAQKFAMAVMSKMDTARDRFNAALKILKEQPETDTSQIAAIGYCFGGGVVLRMALAGMDLKGVVSFHGDLPAGPVKDPGKVKAKILVCNGAADQFNPIEKVEEFEKNIKDAGIDFKVINYPDAMHSFTNPAADSLGKKFSLPIGYNKNADEKSWIDMQAFFCEIFNF
ncbi:MAG: dienelactone hydrolase family protein, partial [Ignavibacteriaceae bacterium]